MSEILRRQEMRFKTSMRLFALLAGMALLLSGVCVFAQETTGGLQGTIKDASGAVVTGAHVVVTGTALEGSKALDTDSSGYYRFANLPPGTYAVTVTSKAFKTAKREGINIAVGHLPTVDITLEVGTASEVVEVTGAAPLIDTTTNSAQTNVTQDIIENAPHGYTFQSVIQYAPMARNEPLSGAMGGNGGAIPGSSGNGYGVGFMIGGAADSESQYLVEGQDTEDISGGASRAQVPFDFIQEVQVKTSGIEAEHGGALGGVINVVMRKGSNATHGSFFGSYEADSMDGSPNATLRYDPLDAAPNPVTGEANIQNYQPRKDHFRIAQPGFTVGGPVMKDRLWYFVGFAPQYRSLGRTVDFGPSFYPGNPALGRQAFTQDVQQYFGTARLDATLTSKIRVFASWLYQYQRLSGSKLPGADSIASQNYHNNDIDSPLQAYSHGLGYSQPNSTYNVGADITLTPKIVSTTRFGYFFNNYHDFGWPTTGVNLFVIGVPGQLDNTGAPMPTSLQLPGADTNAYDGSFTDLNASKHWQFNQDVAFFKSGWAGTHNIKVGYQFNRLWNEISQHGNIPDATVRAYGSSYSPGTAYGATQCDQLSANPWGACTGQYGYAYSNDFGTILRNSAGQLVPATDNNHALFVQDAWTVGKGLTLNLGIRVEKENLPAPPGIGIAGIRTINWTWSDKVEPRLGAAWGSRDGKIKIFGSYGVVNDVMKLLLAQSSFGAQVWDRCYYPVGPDANGTFDWTDVTLQFIGQTGRACPTAGADVGANFAGGVVPQVFTNTNPLGQTTQLIENLNFRPEEPVAPGVKPYRQHEYVAGGDYQISKDWALEVRYDRRRLDHVIEDASLSDPFAFEIYTIVNPGQGVNKTLNGYADFLTSLGEAYGVGVPAFNGTPGYPFGTCTGCPNNPEAVRNYDGVEVRLTKTASKGWAGMFSYTYSSLWGNYTGLTTTDQIDGGATGRNSPDTTRAFDEPFYYFTYKGTSGNGPLPTDRPNALKGNVYYSLPWKGMTTTIGLFQVAYQGSPVSSWTDVGYGNGGVIEGTYIWGRGNWANASTDGAGNITLGNVYARRTPWYTQTDLNVSHSFKVNKNNEHQLLTFQATLTNLLNQHAVVAYWAGLNSDWIPSALLQYQLFNGASFYQTAETGYDPQAQINQQATDCLGGGSGFSCPIVQNAQYGLPNVWQSSRTIRVAAKFTF
jgi:hypothetical protein